MTALFSILLTAILTKNFVLSQFLGICPFLGVSKKLHTALGMSAAVLFVMAFATAVCWPINEYLLGETYAYLQTIVFILVIAALVQLVEILLKKYMPPLYNALGIYLPLIVVNCIILARAESYASCNKPFYSMVDGLSVGIGFTAALCLIGIVREFLSSGSFAGFAIPGFPAMSGAGASAFGFIVFGCLVALVNKLTHGKAIKKKEFTCADCPVASVCGQSSLTCEKGEC